MGGFREGGRYPEGMRGARKRLWSATAAPPSPVFADGTAVRENRPSPRGGGLALRLELRDQRARECTYSATVRTSWSVKVPSPREGMDGYRCLSTGTPAST